MKVAQLAALGVAVVAGGGAYVVANNLSAPPEQVQQVQQDQGPRIELGEVLVATNNISLGTSLKDTMVEWKPWPKDGIGQGYITRSNSPDGLDLANDPAIARGSFFAGEPIRESKLVRSDKGYMSAILPAGQQAVATSISTATSAGGFILPNDRVDVIMTRRTGENDDIFETETILENVRVLAIDQTIEEKEDGEPVVVGETATLQLSPDQAKILTVAQQMADRLSLALRSLEDSGSEETKGAEHLLIGGAKSGRVKIIKFGSTKEIITGTAQQKN
ncbi:MAG: Flp pilus assembly protein CpaB [Rhizobiaceae bacterium]|nr:Flp pilus assembly protein CpaB [Rhizobiaceae bacterium]